MSRGLGDVYKRQEEDFGIRLEDDVVINENGEPTNLMENIPIEIEHIEDLMNSK